MKSILTTVLLVFSIFYSYGQTCNCNQELTNVVGKIEKNYAGFKDKVNSKTETSYYNHTQAALERSKHISKPAYCVSLINDWLVFFKDGHIQVGRNRISGETEKIWLKKRLEGIEHFDLTAKQLSELKSSKGITGIYYNADSTLKIAIIKNKNSFRDYVGVVISAKQDNWLPGQVILEAKSNTDSLKGILYDKYLIPESVSLAVNRDAVGTYIREGSRRTYTEAIANTLVASKILSPKTLYLKIGTFNQTNAKNIDSLVHVNRSNLNTMPNLILDLRNNGGGADFSYKSITPYLYTNALKITGADVLATHDNIAGWNSVATTTGIPDDQKVFISEVVQKMKQNKGKLVPLTEDQTISPDSITSYPKKIIILINRNCGSTTEEFLLLAKQSSKVILMGEPTKGVLDYANVRGADFSCMPYMLYWATSRSRRIDQHAGIDNVGILPDSQLSSAQNWIQEAQSYLERR